MRKNKLRRWKENLEAWGFKRGIERHNFLALTLGRKYIRSLPCRGRVIDLGCGEAPYRQDILSRADKYIGVDWPRGLHKKDRTDVFADLRAGLPFRDGAADTVTAFSVLEHIPEPEHLLSECRRILKPGGSLFMLVPFDWHIHEEPHDYYRYTRYGLKYLLEKTGFAEIGISGITGFWLLWFLKFNYHTTRYARGAGKYGFYPLWWLTQVIPYLADKRIKDTSDRDVLFYEIRVKKT